MTSSTPPLRRRVAVVAVSLALALAGCSAGQSSSSPVVATANPNTAELVAQRLAAGLPDCQPPDAAAPVLYGLPNVVLPCLGSDRSLDLAAVRGPAVVNLWAQWCAPCRAEAPALAEFGARAAGKVTMLGIDYTDPRPDKAIEFARSAGWRYPHLTDPDGVLMSRMSIPGIPVTLLIGADGRIVYRKTGPVASADELADLLAQHLGVRV